MPELPEVETVVRELNRKLKNKTIKSVEVLLPKIVSLGPGTVSPKRQVSSSKVSKFIRLLKGQKIRLVARRAKLLIFDFYRGTRAPNLTRSSGTLSQVGEGVGERQVNQNTELTTLRQMGVKIDGSLAMLVHLKMTGQFIYLKKTQLNKKIRILNKANASLLLMPCKYTHVIFSFTDGSKLFFNDLRQFGYLKLVADSELDCVKELKDFGYEPLDKSFTLEKYLEIVKTRPNGKIKQVLMDPKLVAGIGNIYSDEILFHAGVRPGRKVSSLKHQVLGMIFNEIKRVLRKGIETKGSSVGDFIRTDGSWGRMGKYHYVYGRAGQECKKCGTIVKSEKFNGRTGSFCPSCQV